MVNIGKYIRIFNSTPDDDFVTKRIASINSIEAIIKEKTSTTDLLQLANELIKAAANPQQTNTTINEIAEPALKEQSTSFVADGEQIQLATCTLLATTQFLERFKENNSKLSVETILAMALWSGLSYQNPHSDKEKFEYLRSELIAVVTNITTNLGISSRLRRETQPRVELLAPPDNDLPSLITNLNTSDGKLIDALRFNALLDREEIDILWWALAGWSKISNSQIGSLNPVQATIVSALEISGLLARIPAEAHAHLSCRFSPKNDSYDGNEILEQLGILISPISEFILQHDLVKNNALIFPVFNLLTGFKSSGVETKRGLIEWASRLLLEGSMLNLNRLSDNE